MDDRHAVRTERGFALVLAMLSLMLLTFLGLTLAATTSTELQIATNYRWSQQALYNAEAGIEAARVGLSELVVREPVRRWGAVLPQVRTLPSRTWVLGVDTPPTPIELPGADGDFKQRDECDSARAGVGYGLVLATGAADPVGRDGTPGRFLEVSSFRGQPINGAFTVWIRREIVTDPTNGKAMDSALDEDAVIVSEGIAPYIRSDSAFAQARQAIRVMEARIRLDVTTEECRNEVGQEGGSATGSGYNSCAAGIASRATEELGGMLEATAVQALRTR